MSYVIFSTKFDKTVRNFSIQRVSYTIEDTFKEEIDNGNMSHYKKITVKGKMKKNEINSFKIVYAKKQKTNISTGRINGKGTLYFSDTSDSSQYYMKISPVSIISINESDNTWTTWGDIEAVFSDETGNESNNGLLTFVGTDNKKIKLYNAQIEVIPSHVRRSYSQVKNHSGSFIQELGFDFISIRINGEMPYDSCDFPYEILKIIESYSDKKYEKNYSNTNSSAFPSEYEYYPICQDLNKFLPALKTTVKHAFVSSSQLVWDIEKKQISVNIEIVAPNQKLGDFTFSEESDSESNNIGDDSDSDFVLVDVTGGAK